MSPPTFGELFAELRRSLDLTLSEFCSRNDFDIGYVSKMERSVLPPPASDEKLEAYARALRLEPGSDEWDNFVDTARLQRNEIPREVITDEEMMLHMRILFRTARGKKVPDEKIQELIDYLKGQ